MISIVIPTLNSEKYISNTICSICNQNYQDYEVILVDSYSDDYTLMIAYQWQKIMGDKLQIYQMPREGQIKAINYGISLAKGDILTFLNGDDLYCPGCLTEVNRIFATHQGKEWAFGKGGVVDSTGKPARSLVTQFKAIWWKKNSHRVLTWFDYICQPTVFWRRELMEKVGKFNPEYPLCFDYEYWLRAWNISTPIFINKHLADWRAHSNSVSVKNTNEQINESLQINIQYAQTGIDIVLQNIIAIITKVVYGFMYV